MSIYSEEFQLCGSQAGLIGIGAGVLQSNEDVEVFVVPTKSHSMETERKESTIKIDVNSIL
uniref:Uncharacterized protein n=1 Tax=Daphnia galeata TaxID=27404 RepID=A0A8J2S498_9CRUS|nr:unnamed protein product [Daphnia galeata]